MRAGNTGFRKDGLFGETGRVLLPTHPGHCFSFFAANKCKQPLHGMGFCFQPIQQEKSPYFPVLLDFFPEMYARDPKLAFSDQIKENLNMLIKRVLAPLNYFCMIFRNSKIPLLSLRRLASDSCYILFVLFRVLGWDGGGWYG